MDAPVGSIAARDALAADLLPGERNLWAGRPNPRVFLQSSDAAYIPLSLLVLGLALFWEWGVLHASGVAVAKAFFALWGVPFFCIGVYLVVGRFVMEGMIKRRTYYAVTDRRALVRTGLTRSVVQSADLGRLSGVTMDVRPDGIGTIVFAANPPDAGGWLSGWSRFPASPRRPACLCFGTSMPPTRSTAW